MSQKIESITLTFRNTGEDSAVVSTKLYPESLTWEEVLSEETVEPCVYLAYQCLQYLNENEEQKSSYQSETPTSIN